MYLDGGFWDILGLFKWTRPCSHCWYPFLGPALQAGGQLATGELTVQDERQMEWLTFFVDKGVDSQPSENDNF